MNNGKLRPRKMSNMLRAKSVTPLPKEQLFRTYILMNFCSFCATVSIDWTLYKDCISQISHRNLAIVINGKYQMENQWKLWNNKIKFNTFIYWEKMRLLIRLLINLWPNVWILNRKIKWKLSLEFNLIEI